MYSSRSIYHVRLCLVQLQDEVSDERVPSVAGCTVDAIEYLVEAAAEWKDDAVVGSDEVVTGNALVHVAMNAIAFAVLDPCGR